ncbi:MAG: hypothetical protein AAF492_00780, partial [Verrucomicrobiota bacterium]
DFDLGALPALGGTTITVQVFVRTNPGLALTNHVSVATVSTEFQLSNNIAAATNQLADTDLDQEPDLFDDDDDNDGMSDEHEAIAATDARDPNSYFFTRIDLSPGDVTTSIAFPSATGRLYRIESLTNLITGSWQALESDIPGTGSMIERVVTNFNRSLIYRVLVERP